MNLRKLSAHYLFPGNGTCLRNGILVLTADGTVKDVRDTRGQLKEEASLEFFNGILLPEFLNPCQPASSQNVQIPHLTPDSLITGRDGYQCFCPTAYLRQHTIPIPFHQLEPHLNRLCIGSEEQNPIPYQSMLNELLCLQNLYPEITLPQLARLASLNSALALSLGLTHGSFEPGKRPGVLFIENADLANLKLRADSRAVNLLPGLRP